MPDDIKTDPKTTENQDKKEETPPSKPQDGQGEKPKEEHVETIPEKFKGKSAEEIAKAYVDLEKKLGEHSDKVKRVGDLEEEIKQWHALGDVIQSDPELQAALKKKATGGDKAPAPRDDTRKALETQIISSFEAKYGLSSLAEDKRKGLYTKIGSEIREMFDPSGTMSSAEIIDKLPLDRLNLYLEKAYKLATSDDREEQLRSEGYLKAKQNNEATLGSMPSSTVQSDIELTPEQRETARKMGISEKDYKEQVKKINEEEK